MLRWATIVLIVIWLAACGQKGPLVLPDDARRKQAPPASHEVPSAEDPKQ